ncbi:MAG: NAD(P)/FAD-dependent oxidoreductase [Candidatus Hodarchaeales archaeon]
MVTSKAIFDIMIVGAGPAGASAASHASQLGFSTCILEKADLKRNGRYKACGGALDWKLIETLEYPEERIARIVDTLVLHHLDGESYSKSGEGAVVWRSIFDNFLTDVARRDGAIVKDNEPVINISQEGTKYLINTPKGEYQANYVLAADGVSSTVLKLLKWPRIPRNDLILTITQEMRLSQETIDQQLGKSSLHLFFSIKHLSQLGYAWLFPKKDVLTVGWGNQLTRITHARQEFQSLLEVPLVKETLAKSSMDLFKGHLIPVGLRPQLFNKNVFALGDAGGLVDPISGKGIPYAIISGQIAIDVIKQCINTDEEEKIGELYEKALNKSFVQMLRAKRLARDRIYEDDLTLKRFLELWEKYRSSEIVARNLI